VKLLFLAHRVPYPPDKGDKIRSYHELRALAERGHEMHLLAFADEAEDLRFQPALANICASTGIVSLGKRRAGLRAIGGLFGQAPLTSSYFATRPMARAVRRKTGEVSFDSVFVCSSSMANYVPDDLAARGVVDLVDADSEKWADYALLAPPPSAWIYQLESRRLRRHERKIVARFAWTLLTTEREAALLELDEHLLQERVQVITNGVDLERYRPETCVQCPAARVPSEAQESPTERSAARFVFVGAMDYFANVDGACFFAEAVLPLIRESESGAEFVVVGRKPARRVRHLTRLPGVKVTGYVQDVRPYLASATACVVPLRIARGVQNKVLEAMASGCAVIATPQAVAGLKTVPGEHVLIGRSPQELARAALMVRRDAPLRARLGEQARRFVKTEHNWAPLLERVVEVVEAAASKGAPAARAPLA
jgi:sugar transferase (PEP-CTERM/EpsH1 system associated)